MHDALIIAEALPAYYRAHGLPPDGGASDPWFRVAIGPLSIRLPNPPARRRAVKLHDINHLMTGYNTVFSEGEMAIAAFEVGAGCGRFALVWLINLSMFAFGLMLQPRAEWVAFLRGWNSRSIYHVNDAPSVWDACSIAEARAALHIDTTPIRMDRRAVRSFFGWAFVAVTLVLTPLLLGLFAWSVR